MSFAAFVLYLVFVSSWFLHLSARLPILGTIRFDLILVLLITALCAVSSLETRAGESENRQVGTRNALLVLVAYCVVTLPFVEWPGSVLRTGFEQFAKAVVFYYFTVSLIRTPSRLVWLLGVFMAGLTIRVLEPTYLHVTTDYWGAFANMSEGGNLDRLSGSPYDVINPNGLAYVIVSLLSFAHFLAPLTRMGALAYLVGLPVSLYALVLTGSRSGLLGLAAVFLVVWVKSRQKVLLAVVGVAAVAVALPRMSGDMVDRYASIVDSSTRNARTAEGRLQGARRSFTVALHRPLFGHGLGTSREASANFGESDQPAHILYGEVAQELGFVGLAIFLIFLGTTARNLWAIGRTWNAASTPPRLLLRSRDALQTFMLMSLLLSFASYGLTSYEWYFLAGLTDALGTIYSAKGQVEPLVEPAGSLVR
jgi:putative inorganic carbon (HCO3(-)) transporter